MAGRIRLAVSRCAGLACALVCVTSTWAQSNPAAGKHFAVLVGVENYAHPSLREPPLKYSCDDVTSLAEVLRSSGYDVTLLSDDVGASNPELVPTRSNIESHIKSTLRGCGPQDTILLAFAGHGLQFAGQPDAYFCPQDARPFKDEMATLVSISSVYSELEKSFAGVKIILVDACRNDPDPARGRGVDADSAPPPPRGVAALFSCSSGQRAFEHDELKHGVFFHHVLQGLEGKAANGDGEVTFDSLSSHVRSQVPRDVARLVTGQRQFPNLKADLVGVPPVLARIEKARPIDKPRPEEPVPATGVPHPDAVAAKERGNVLLAKRELAEALTHYNEAVRIDPNYASPYVNRGSIFLAQGDHVRAMEEFNHAIALDPKLSSAFNNRGNLWKAKGDLDQALADYGEAHRLDPQNAIALNNRGFVRLLKEDFDVAIVDFTESIRLNPKTGETYLNRGGAWEGKGDFDKAILDFTEAIRLNPQSGRAFRNRGWAWMKKGNLDKALSDYTEAIRLEPQDKTAFVNRGNVLQSRGENDKAISDHTEAIRLDPQYHLAFHNRGVARLAKKEFDKAISDYTEAIRLNPQLAASFHDRGRAWYAKSNHDKAIADYSDAIRLDPKLAGALRDRAISYRAKGDRSKAEADDREASKLEEAARRNQ